MWVYDQLAAPRCIARGCQRRRPPTALGLCGQAALQSNTSSMRVTIERSRARWPLIGLQPGTATHRRRGTPQQQQMRNLFLDLSICLQLARSHKRMRLEVRKCKHVEMGLFESVKMKCQLVSQRVQGRGCNGSAANHAAAPLACSPSAPCSDDMMSDCARGTQCRGCEGAGGQHGSGQQARQTRQLQIASTSLAPTQASPHT